MNYNSCQQYYATNSIYEGKVLGYLRSNKTDGMENGMSVSDNLKRGITELSLLCLLSQRDMYGYEMVQALAEYSEGNFCLQESSLYPTLYRLQDKKCISARQVAAGKRRRRTYYHLEQAGRDYLQQSLQEYLSVQKGFCGILDKTGNSGDEK